MVWLTIIKKFINEKCFSESFYISLACRAVSISSNDPVFNASLMVHMVTVAVELYYKLLIPECFHADETLSSFLDHE